MVSQVDDSSRAESGEDGESGGEGVVGRGAASRRQGRYRRRTSGAQRTLRTVIRHSPEEYARVVSVARGQGVSVPRLYERALWAGDAVAAARMVRLLREADVILRVVANAANNVNQLARVANSTGEVHAAQVEAAAAHLEGQLAQLRVVVQSAARGELFDIHAEDIEDTEDNARASESGDVDYEEGLVDIDDVAHAHDVDIRVNDVTEGDVATGPDSDGR